MKKLYGVGTGPGDKSLLTLKAVEIIEKVDLIFAPNNKGKNMSLDTCKDFIGDKEIVLLDFPMGKVTREDYIKNARLISEKLGQDKTGAYLTIGDPMVYSTFIYLMEELDQLEVEVEIISGLPSFIVAAARMKKPLCLKGENFLLMDELEEGKLDGVDSFALLKASLDLEKTVEVLDESDFSYKLIRRISFPQEEIIEDKEKILANKDYMSLFLGRREKDEEGNFSN